MAIKATTAPKLTDDQKARFAPILRATWEYIGGDAETLFEEQDLSLKERQESVIELVCDADRPCGCGMSREDYAILAKAYHHPDTQQWLKKELKY